MSMLTGAKPTAVGSCYVFRVLRNAEIRCASSPDSRFQTGRWFKEGDLVSVDFIRKIQGSSDPFLRLSDGSGWLIQREKHLFAEQVEVETGLWCFFVQNHHSGISLRNHPIDRMQPGSNFILLQIPVTTVKPNLKIYCDRRVKNENGVFFYRLQQDHTSRYPAWVFDRRVTKDGAEFKLLLPESKVQTGLFAFQALAKTSIQTIPTLSNDAKTTWFVKEGDTVVGDLVQEDSQEGSDGGPFLRLLDGTGWLFVRKRNKEVLRSVPIEEGKWVLQVTNPDGMQLRKQPSDSTMSRFTTIYKHDEVIHCDRKIFNESTGTSFYRVKGTQGWVFDIRKNFEMMKLIPQEPEENEEEKVATDKVNITSQWTVEFVRGVATGSLEGLLEVIHNQENQFLVFEHPDGARINVYYKTRTIGVGLERGNPGKTQLVRHNCSKDELAEIFRQPDVIKSRKGYQGATSGKMSLALSMSEKAQVNIEEDFRNRLLELDREMDAIQQRKKALWRSLDIYEADREKTEIKMKQQTRAHAKIMLDSLVLHRQKTPLRSNKEMEGLCTASVEGASTHLLSKSHSTRGKGYKEEMLLQKLLPVPNHL